MRTLVVGGGVSGVLCAALARRRGEVLLIERGPALGGLLGAFEGPDGLRFDHGTHVPQETGEPSVDGVLFSGMADSPWRKIDVLEAGSIAFGRLNETSPFPDLRDLPARVYAQVMVELVEAGLGPADEAPPATSAADLRARFGETLTTTFFAPLLEGIYGVGLDELAPGAHEFFLSRVIGFSSQTARALKQLPALDARIAFHTNEEAPSTRTAWYPETGGCGRWIDDLSDRLLGDVDVEVGCEVVGLEVDRDRIVAARLSTGRVPTDDLIWTLPGASLAAALGRSLPEGVRPPIFVRTVLHHLLLDRPFTTDVHYATSFDPEVDLFRVTMYPALRGRPFEPPFAATVEIMRSPLGPARADPSTADVVASLKALGLVDPAAIVTWSGTETIPNGFPVPTVAFRSDTARVADLASDGLTNVRLVGRGTGKVFFMADVLKQCFNEVA